MRDKADLALHLRSCWENPVRHGLVARAEAMPYSAIQRDTARDMVSLSWA